MASTGAMLFFLAALVIVAGQVLLWLNRGKWPGLSILNVIVLVNPASADWIIDPQSWIGLHKLLSEIPLALWFVGFGWVFLNRI